MARYRLTARKRLSRSDGENVAPGEVFEPTEAERRAFSDLLEPVEEPETPDDTDAPDETDPPFDPGDTTVAELEDILDESSYSGDELDALSASEREGENRQTAHDAIDAARSSE